MATVEITQRCLDEDFSDLPEAIEAAILRKLEVLRGTPEFGKPLVDELAGFRRVTHGRYRVVYRYHQPSDTVFVVLVGLRKEDAIDDVYTVARRLLRSGKLMATVEQIKVANKLNRRLLENVKSRIREKPRDLKDRGGA